MDIQQLKFASEVESAGSISAAADRLFISQPYLSRAIRELERDLGFELFQRTSRGAVPTKRGAEFLARAREIVINMDDLESDFCGTGSAKLDFEIAVPIACYQSQAFVNFARTLGRQPQMRLTYHETNTATAIAKVLNYECSLGIIRCRARDSESFRRYMQEKNLVWRPIWKFDYHLVLSKASPIADKPEVTEEDLLDLIEITHGDPGVPAETGIPAIENAARTAARRQIVVYERQSQFELLCAIPETYMWASPTPPSVLETYPLVQRTCSAGDNRYMDVLFYRKGHKLNERDRLFIEVLQHTVGEMRSGEENAEIMLTGRI